MISYCGSINSSEDSKSLLIRRFQAKVLRQHGLTGQGERRKFVDMVGGVIKRMGSRRTNAALLRSPSSDSQIVLKSNIVMQ